MLKGVTSQQQQIEKLKNKVEVEGKRKDNYLTKLEALTHELKSLRTGMTFLVILFEYMFWNAVHSRGGKKYEKTTNFDTHLQQAQKKNVDQRVVACTAELTSMKRRQEENFKYAKHLEQEMDGLRNDKR